MRNKRVSVSKFNIPTGSFASMKLFVQGLTLAVLLVMSCGNGMSQTGIDYVTAGIDFASSHSIIRSVSDTDAVVYYEKNNACWLARINTSGVVRQIPIGQEMDVRDLRVTEKNVYFCGQYRGRAFIGNISLDNFYRPFSAIVNYYVLDPDETSVLTRLVAYKQHSEERIAAIGRFEYVNSAYYSCSWPNPPITCFHSILVEGVFRQNSLPSFEMIALYSSTNHECLNEVIATRNYVAVVGINNEKLTIHRCKKDQVIQTFDQYYSYSFYDQEGLSPFVGCSMPFDSIAIASMSSDCLVGGYETRLRTFDLVSMRNVQAQSIGRHEKSVPYEITYLPRYQTVVMSHEEFDPITGTLYTPFIYWKPNHPSIGFINKICDQTSRFAFASISYLGSEHYIAAGGDYWMMKHLPSTNLYGNCYNVDYIRVATILTLFEISKVYSWTPKVLAYSHLASWNNVQTLQSNINCMQSSNSSF